MVFFCIQLGTRYEKEKKKKRKKAGRGGCGGGQGSERVLGAGRTSLTMGPQVELNGAQYLGGWLRGESRNESLVDLKSL